MVDPPVYGKMEPMLRHCELAARGCERTGIRSMRARLMILEIDARRETIARKVLARLNSKLRRSQKKSAEIDRNYRIVENGIVKIC
jgi:hypothetical protein